LSETLRARFGARSLDQRLLKHILRLLRGRRRSLHRRKALPASSRSVSTDQKGNPLVRHFSVTPAEAQRLAIEGRAVIVDVREQDEWDEAHVSPARHIPLDQLAKRHDEIPRDKDVIVMCRSGHRSATAQEYLLCEGFEYVANLEGGIIAWKDAALPTNSR
jgi:rhodanese-related sulfurtransferase